MGIYKRDNVWWMHKQHKGRSIQESLNTGIKKEAEKRYADILSSNRFGGFRDDGAHAHGLGEVKEFSRLRFLRGERNERVTDGLELALVELGLHFADDLRRSVVIERHRGFFLAEAALGREFDHPAARLGNLLERLEQREAIESVSDATDVESSGLVCVGDFNLRAGGG